MTPQHKVQRPVSRRRPSRYQGVTASEIHLLSKRGHAALLSPVSLARGKTGPKLQEAEKERSQDRNSELFNDHSYLNRPSSLQTFFLPILSYLKKQTKNLSRHYFISIYMLKHT